MDPANASTRPRVNSPSVHHSFMNPLSVAPRERDFHAAFIAASREGATRVRLRLCQEPGVRRALRLSRERQPSSCADAERSERTNNRRPGEEHLCVRGAADQRGGGRQRTRGHGERRLGNSARHGCPERCAGRSAVPVNAVPEAGADVEVAVGPEDHTRRSIQAAGSGRHKIPEIGTAQRMEPQHAMIELTSEEEAPVGSELERHRIVEAASARCDERPERRPVEFSKRSTESWSEFATYTFPSGPTTIPWRAERPPTPGRASAEGHGWVRDGRRRRREDLTPPGYAMRRQSRGSKPQRNLPRRPRAPPRRWSVIC